MPMSPASHRRLPLRQWPAFTQLVLGVCFFGALAPLPGFFGQVGETSLPTPVVVHAATPLDDPFVRQAAIAVKRWRPSSELPIHQARRCSRALSREANTIVQADIIAKAEGLGVQLSPDCPLLPARDMYRNQESRKSRTRMHHHKCGECEKAFRSEEYLDLHLERFHPVDGSGKGCLADYCPILGCPSRGSDPGAHAGTQEPGPRNTDDPRNAYPSLEGLGTDRHDTRRRLFVCEALISRCLQTSNDADLDVPEDVPLNPSLARADELSDYLYEKFCSGFVDGSTRSSNIVQPPLTNLRLFVVVLVLVSLIAFYGILWSTSTGSGSTTADLQPKPTWWSSACPCLPSPVRMVRRWLAGRRRSRSKIE